MKKIIIIDDEAAGRTLIKQYLAEYPTLIVVGEANNGVDAIKVINEFKPDLIFLDIQMPKITGFEMLELIDNPPQVIFTTAFEEYAIKAFDAHAADYLLKPFSKERFDKAMQKLQQQRVNAVPAIVETAMQSTVPNNRIVVKDNGKIKIIPLAQVQWLEAADDYVKIITAEGSFLKKKTMQHFENSLSPQEFIRIHRSYIVNAALITRIDLHEKDSHLALLTTGARLPVSKAGYTKLKEVLGI